MSTPRPWRLPRPKKKRRIPTPRPAPTPEPKKPSSRPPPPTFTFETLQIGPLPVLVSSDALQRFTLPELRKALIAHGALRGTRETKHRFDNAGTLVILSRSATGEITMLTVAQLREMRGNLKKFAPTATNSLAGKSRGER